MDTSSTNAASEPALFSAQRVLCVQPHYDDNDIYAGGTIARLHDRGAEIYYLTVTDDLVGGLDQSLTDEQMTRQFRAEQKQAGESTGVDQFYWLGYPDAGDYDYFQLRKEIMGYLRLLRPDYVFTVDPWLPYEVHRDHIITGRAACEAAFLAGFSRLKTRSEIDQNYSAHEIKGLVLYNSAHPNLVVDISQAVERKHRAAQAYRGQFWRRSTWKWKPPNAVQPKGSLSAALNASRSCPRRSCTAAPRPGRPENRD